MTDPVVSVEWLRAQMQKSRVVIADCRFKLADKGYGRRSYEAGHIPGAVYLDLDQDLSAPVGPHGGRHPLPEPAVLAQRLGACGIGDDTMVVAYDEDGSMAPRLWWLLRYLGHDAVTVLSGGIRAWQDAGGEISTEMPTLDRRTLTVRVRPQMVVSMEEVRDRPAGTVLVDARAPARYRGEIEPLDPKAGHIPGAVNLFWELAVDDTRRWLGPEAQRERFAAAIGRPAMIACGSGVTACCNLLALAIAGEWDAKLYAGSYSDWLTYPENPVATGDEGAS